MTFAKVIRTLQSEPFNQSISEIRQMTMPMIRNLLGVLSDPTGEQATVQDVQKLLGKKPIQPPRKAAPRKK